MTRVNRSAQTASRRVHAQRIALKTLIPVGEQSGSAIQGSAIPMDERRFELKANGSHKGENRGTE